MGFSANPVRPLDFGDRPELAGLEVHATGATVGEVIGLHDFNDVRIVNGVFHPDDADKVEGMYRVLLDHIREWNLEDDERKPLPITYRSLKQVDAALVLDIYNAWVSRVTGRVSGPLEQPSTNGEQSEEEYEIPMEPLSENPPS